MTDPESTPHSGEVLYLYCFAASKDLDHIRGTGIDEASSLFLCPEGDVTAVLSHAALGEFTGDSGEENLGDINWITPRACSHQAVISRVMNHSPVLPVRFGTLFLSQASLDRTVRAHHDEISAFLEQARGREEWAIKGYMDRKKALKQVCADLAEQAEAAGPPKNSPGTGVRYFEKKKMEQKADTLLTQTIHETVMAIADILEPMSVDMNERDLMSRAATGKETDMVLNWAALLEKEKIPGFRNQIDEVNDAYRENGLALEFSGPWPPYSFCPAIGTDDEKNEKTPDNGTAAP